MQPLTERQIATACGIAPADMRIGKTLVYPVAGTPSHTKEHGANVSHERTVSPRSRLSLRARIQRLERHWLRWRELPAKARENWITTSIYLMACAKARRGELV